MNRLSNLLTGASIGSAMMYYFDPIAGNRRRSLLRDQITHVLNKAGDAADATWRDFQNRAYGTLAELRSCVTGDDADDEVLVQRVRSKMGRHVSHPSAIDVASRNGVIRLSGPILAHEVDDLICAVQSVRGVQDVEDHLEVHTTAGNISALQGGAPRTGEPSEIMQEYWSPTARCLIGTAGSALVMRCLARRTPASMLLGTAGFAMALRALTNQEIRRVFGVGGGRRGIDVQKTTIINRPLEEVFEFLADPQNYPHFTDMVTSVRELSDGRIQKTLSGPAGAELTIHERVTRLVPNEFIACRSEPDSPLQYAARAWFEPMGDSSTRVHIQATYNPPGGVLAHSAAWMAGLDPKSQLDNVMMRAKSMLETGKPPRDAAQPQAEHRGTQQERKAGEETADTNGANAGETARVRQTP